MTLGSSELNNSLVQSRMVVTFQFMVKSMKDANFAPTGGFFNFLTQTYILGEVVV
jgi:hypothetical protein